MLRTIIDLYISWCETEKGTVNFIEVRKDLLGVLFEVNIQK